MSLNTARPIEILLVEDSPSDAALTIEAFQAGKILNNLNRVVDGVEAIAYLRRQGRFANSRRPDLIMLDLNLPKKDGREVLRELKSDPSLKLIPIIVLTTSKADKACGATAATGRGVDIGRASRATAAGTNTPRWSSADSCRCEVKPCAY